MTPQYAVFAMLDRNRLSSLPDTQLDGCVWLFDSQESAYAWRLRKLIEAGEVTHTDPVYPPVCSVGESQWVRFDDAAAVWEDKLEPSEFFHVFEIGADGMTICRENLEELSGQLEMF